MNSLHLWPGDGSLEAAVFLEEESCWVIAIDQACRQLELELISFIEAQTDHPIELDVLEGDPIRSEILQSKGWEKLPWHGRIYHMRLDEAPKLEPELPDGFMIREVNAETRSDAQGVALLLNAAFGRTFHTAEEHTWFTRQAPCYRGFLDLGVFDGDGCLAAYAGAPYVPEAKRGIFEPICTHPEHRRKGLARALMQEGLNRLRALKAFDVILGTGDMIPANALYESMGFTSVQRVERWRRP